MTRRLKHPQTGRDWKALDFVIELRRRHSSWAQLAREQGWHPNTLRTVVDRPWPKAERIVADFLGVSPDVIWPSRYGARKDAA